MLRVVPQGRHRYFQLAAPDVAVMLESMMGVAQRRREVASGCGPRDPALRRARRCYDHLAGSLAVDAFEAFVARGLLRLTPSAESTDTLVLTAKGERFFAERGIAVAEPGNARRPVCRPCLDWSVRRHHLAGSLGKALLDHCLARRWAGPVKGSRIIRFSADGEAQFRTLFAA